MNKLLQSLSALGVSATLVTPNLSAEATDNSIPELKGTKDTIIHKGDAYQPLKGVRAFDKEDGDLTHKITVDGDIDTSKPENIKSFIKSKIQMVQLENQHII